MTLLKTMVHVMTFGGALAAVSLVANPGHATTYTINTNNMSLSAPGCGLREAIHCINNGVAAYGCPAPQPPPAANVINLQYDDPNSATETYQTTIQLRIYKSVTIVGRGRNTTILKAQGGVRIDANNGSSDVNVVLEDLSVQKHSSQTSSTPGIAQYGYSSGTSGKLVELTLDRVVVTGFTASTSNAVYVSAPDITNDTNVWTSFTANDSFVQDNGGAGIAAFGKQAGVVLTGTSVSNNDNRGLYLSNARLQLNHSSVVGNSTLGDGGGIYMTATPTGDPDDQSNITLYDSLVANNIAEGGEGGGVYFSARNGIDVQRSTISGNHTGAAATGRGGGIFADRPTGSASYIKIKNSTIAYNRARSAGGGLWDSNGGNGTPELGGTLLAKNTLGPSNNQNGNPSPSGTDIYWPSSGMVAIDPFFDLIGTRQGVRFFCYDVAPPPDRPWCYPHVFPASPTGSIDPKLEPSLTNAGGGTLVHTFQPTSPAIDFGDCSLMGPPHDQRGFRVDVDYDFDQGANACDIGAYEAGGYETLGGYTSFRPASMTYTDTTGVQFLEVFITGWDGNIYSRSAEILPSGALSLWYPGEFEYVTDGLTAYAPSVVPLANHEAYIFVNYAGGLWAQRRLSNGMLAAWEYLGAFVSSAPAAVNANDEETWAFVRGDDDNLYYMVNYGEWVGWYQVPPGPLFQGDPAATYLSDSKRVYVFGRQYDGTIAYRYYDRVNFEWSSSWQTISGAVAWDPSAAVRTSTAIDLYSLDGTGRLLVGTLNASGAFTGWSIRPNSSAGGVTVPPGASSRANGSTVDVFMVPPSGVVERQHTPW